MPARVLYVDADDARTQHHCSELRRGGHTVTAAGSTAGALAAAAAGRPDVVIVRESPLLDSCQLARALKADPAVSRAAVVVIAADPAGAGLAFFAAGVDLSIEPTTDDADLLAVVEAAASRARLLKQGASPASSPRSPDPPVPQPLGAGVRPVTILLVDDERAIRRLAESVLARAGYTVVSKESMTAAMQWWETHRDEVTLVVTDVVMPAGSGPEMLAAMRKDRPDLAAIVMSGFVSEPHSSTVEASADLFLQKPFTPGELRDAVRRLLDRWPRDGE